MRVFCIYHVLSIYLYIYNVNRPSFNKNLYILRRKRRTVSFDSTYPTIMILFQILLEFSVTRYSGKCKNELLITLIRTVY